MTGRRNRLSPRHRRHRVKISKTGCGTGKYRYADKASADRVRHTAEAERGASGLRSYPCQLCNGWHLTSQREHGS